MVSPSNPNIGCTRPRLVQNSFIPLHIYLKPVQQLSLQIIPPNAPHNSTHRRRWRLRPRPSHPPPHLLRSKSAPFLSAIASAPQKTHTVRLYELDLSSLPSARAFAAQIATDVAIRTLVPIRTLILNAAVFELEGYGRG
ncbi:hypothetical protein BS50DRAFT_320005 [Corynespora cassiicola Philippines]|uniref:Ketoreductase (KR) domain-containing protein n=1 Tax=Corynespora cassiicola Philippines TaxID=1448308 RepID=A0A2T2NT06_CORCC|nr:hypothetical protein BS50DRAFT_320005 [Corynespora cassiicola Philippines]